MIYNEWRKLEHVDKFIDSLDENSLVAMMARTMKFCYDQGGIYNPMDKKTSQDLIRVMSGENFWSIADEKDKYCEHCGSSPTCRVCGRGLSDEEYPYRKGK